MQFRILFPIWSLLLLNSLEAAIISSDSSVNPLHKELRETDSWGCDSVEELCLEAMRPWVLFPTPKQNPYFGTGSPYCRHA